MSGYQKRTKIVATVGPASESKELLTQLAKRGVNVFRLNFSHGSHEDHLQRIERIREVNQENGFSVAILQDLQGPKIRTQLVENNGVELVAGQRFIFAMDEKLLGTSQKVGTTYTSMYKDVNVGERILMDDGNLEVKVISIHPSTKEVETEVIYGGILRSKKGINLPGTNVSLPALTEKDEEDLRFGIAHNVDWVALSFVRTADDIKKVRNIINESGKKIGIVAKVEKPEAIENIDAIIEASDAIMVARGDLGVEIDGAIVPELQKSIIEKCIVAAKPVIVATQMLESMKDNPRPTRAETSDVANAVLDGASATMLSAESASGDYPLESVDTMTHIIEAVERQQNKIKIVKGDEAAIYCKNHSLKGAENSPSILNDRVIAAACRLARDTDAKAIIGITTTGYTALRLSAHRPKAKVYIFTPNREMITFLNLLWGVKSFFLEDSHASVEETVQTMKNYLVAEGHLTAGDSFICTLSMPEKGLRTNTLKLGVVE